MRIFFIEKNKNIHLEYYILLQEIISHFFSSTEALGTEPAEGDLRGELVADFASAGLGEIFCSEAGEFWYSVSSAETSHMFP